MSTEAHTARPSTGAHAWFALMVGAWLAFAVLAVTSEGALDRVRDRVGDLPPVPEIVVWLLALPVAARAGRLGERLERHGSRGRRARHGGGMDARVDSTAA